MDEKQAQEADLDAWLAGEEIPAEPLELQDGATQADLAAQADTRLYWIRRAQRAMAGWRDIAARRREPIDRWEADRVAGEQATIDRETANLEQITRRLIPLTPKGKSLKLPNGTVKLTAAGNASVKVTDEDALLDWLEAERPDLVEVQVVRKVAGGLPALKKATDTREMSEEEQAGVPDGETHMWLVDKETQEVVPGVHAVIPTVDRFSFDL